jgi:formylglycine-generating enzyme required for sulfatase activity
MVMVYVPAGEFEMGSTEGRDDEQPVHTVMLDGFWIDQTEVTNAQYALCVAEGACRESAYAHDGSYNGENYPVVGVSWQDAANYCAWVGGRLPTEAEWEKAARGTDGRTYPWGNSAQDCYKANYGLCIGWRTAAVGSYPAGASPYGALDMLGNVWEWVADWYDADYYSRSPVHNPQGPDSGTLRVLRGRSFSRGARQALRCAFRGELRPHLRQYNVGFRCASPW